MTDQVVRVYLQQAVSRVVIGQALVSQGGGGVTDGDKGGIVVSNSGALWTVKAGSITDLMLSSSAVALFAAASHTHPIEQVTGLQAALAAKQDALGFTPQDASQKGVANGYAGLDGTGKVPAAQLPSFVDDVIEAANFASLPVTGETGKIYVTLNDNKTWRWSGSAYVEISASPGSTDSVTEGATNLYFTAARVRATDLTGYAAAGSRIALAAGDTILAAFGKIGKWLGDLAAVAFSGSASDLSSGTLPAARFDDTAHGSRAGGALHANVIAGGAAGFMTGADKTKLDGVATGATANSSDATLLNRANHTGTQTASTISDFAASVIATVLTGFAVAGARTAIVATDTILAAFGKVQKYLNDLAAVAFSGSASDLGTGTLPAARLPAFGSGDVSFAASGGIGTIAANAVSLSKMAQLTSGTILGRVTAGAGNVEALTGTQLTTLLDPFTSALKGLVPASGGGTANFLRADGTWAAPAAGSGSPGGSTTQLQYNNAGAFAGASSAVIEGNELRLPYISTPTTPAAGGLKLYGMDFGPGAPAFLLPSGKVQLVQSDLGDFNVKRYTPGVGSNSVVLESSLNYTAIGTASAAASAVTNLHQMMPRTDFLVTVAATTAIAGWRHNGTASRFVRVGRDANAPGGFLVRHLWGPATGVATTTMRGFAGLADWTAAPTDVEPSSRTNIIGMGWDAADANIQFMRNDGTGTATKIDLGASFPVPTSDRSEVYEVQLYSPNSTTQSVSYRVIRYNTALKTILAETSGTVTTDLPAVTTLLGPCGAVSVGGTSAVIGAALMGTVVATEY